MIAFLTSSPCSPGSGELTMLNGMRSELAGCLPKRPLCCVYIAGAPGDHAVNDLYANLEKERWETAGFAFARFVMVDDRCPEGLETLLPGCDLLIFAGGHVATQNAWYRQLRLKDGLREFAGVLFTISAGTMNAAVTAYALPEREGEAADTATCRFLPGLGLTEVMVIPHYQELRHTVLDGLRTVEDIACPDSVGRSFLALPDGSYLLLRDGRTELRGEAYRIRDGRVEQISVHGDVLAL